VHWWGSQRTFYLEPVTGIAVPTAHRNIVQGALTNVATKTFQLWATTKWIDQEDSDGIHLRNVTFADAQQSQCLRAGRWSFDPPGESRVVAATFGGSVQVLEPLEGDGYAARRGESDDYGAGGMALEVSKRDLPGL